MIAEPLTDDDIRALMSVARMDNGASAQDVLYVAGVALEQLLHEVGALRATAASVAAIRDELRPTMGLEPGADGYQRGRWQLSHEVADRLDNALGAVTA